MGSGELFRQRAVDSARAVPLARRLKRTLLAVADRGLSSIRLARRIHQGILQDLSIHTVVVPVTAARPAPLHGLRVALLSDIHMGCHMEGADLKEVCSRLAAFTPDLVCLAGDLVNSRPTEVLPFADALPALSPPLGVFAVPGNHDHYWEPTLASWEQTLGRCGVTVLRNRGVRIHRQGHSLWVAGVDDLLESTADVDAALAGRRPGEPAILLSHHPDVFPLAVRKQVDLTLAGHTHGGQIKLAGRTLCKQSKLGYDEGLYAHGASHLYVSRGVGVCYLPVRIGAGAEIPIIELRSVVTGRREQA
jgi:predicted MPP superfamily phosphohydrolase